MVSEGWISEFPTQLFCLKTLKIRFQEEDVINAFVKHSCNGLLLCYVECDDKHYVYNPTLNLFKMIPQPTKSNVKPRYVCDMRIGFDPTQSPYYKLVYATIIGDGDDDDDDDVVSIQMQTYSSEKCSWSAVCIEPFSGKCFPGFGSGIYWNDAIHWLTRIRASHYKIGIANKTVVLTKIQLPVTLDTLCCHRLFESRGSLLLLGKDSTDFHLLYVYEMRNEHSEWSFKYFINLEDNMRCLYTNWMLGEGVPCIALGEREDDSFMVIGTSAKIFQYNIGLKTYRDLSDPDLLFHYDSFLFTASFAGV